MRIVDRAIHSGRVLYALLGLAWLLLAASVAWSEWLGALLAGVSLLFLAPLLGRHALAKRDEREKSG
jgi:multisubunit Na+/H+ antiporter MnhE subunit